MKERAQKISKKNSSFFIGVIGVVCIFISIFMRNVENLPISASLMENIGAAMLIPFLLLIFEMITTGGLRSKRPKIKEYLTPMKKDLRIIGISLYDIHKKTEEFTASLKEQFESKKPKRFTFLILNPNSHFLTYRADEEQKPLKDFLIEIKKTIAILKDRKKDAEQWKNVKSFKIYFYDAPPAHSLIWIDKIMYVGPYFRGQQGYKTLWVDISSIDSDYKYLKKDFQVLLKRKTTKELVEDKDFDEVLKQLEELKQKEEGKDQDEAKYTVG